MPQSEVVEDTPTELLRAARELLVDRGLEGLSMRRVAAACGISAPAIYRHFEDKDALLAQLVLEGFRTFASYLLDALERRTARARFRELGRRYFDFALEHPQDYRLIFMTDCQQLGLPKLDEVARGEISGTFQMLQDRIAECQAEGLFRGGDPRSLAAHVWSSIHGMASLLVTGNLGETPKDIQKLTTGHIDLLERALAA